MAVADCASVAGSGQGAPLGGVGAHQRQPPWESLDDAFTEDPGLITTVTTGYCGMNIIAFGEGPVLDRLLQGVLATSVFIGMATRVGWSFESKCAISNIAIKL